VKQNVADKLEREPESLLCILFVTVKSMLRELKLSEHFHIHFPYVHTQ